MVTVVAARAKVAAARAKLAAARAKLAAARAAVASEHQLLGERMFRAARNVRVVARLRRVPIGRVAGARRSGHAGLYVRVVGLVHGLLTARAAHHTSVRRALCPAPCVLDPRVGLGLHPPGGVVQVLELNKFRPA